MSQSNRRQLLDVDGLRINHKTLSAEPRIVRFWVLVLVLTLLIVGGVSVYLYQVNSPRLIPNLAQMIYDSAEPSSGGEVSYSTDTYAERRNQYQQNWINGTLDWDDWYSDVISTCRVNPVTTPTRIVYSHHDGYYLDWRGGTLFVSNEHGTQYCQLTPFYMAAGNVVRWSPDGMRMAFTIQQADEQQIYHIAQTDAQPTRLTSACQRSQQPDWSPDGQRIVFQGVCGEHTGLFVVGISGDGLVQITEDGEYPQWTNTDKGIVYTVPDPISTEYFRATQVKVMQDDGSADPELLFTQRMGRGGVAYGGYGLMYVSNLSHNDRHQGQLYFAHMDAPDASYPVTLPPALYSQIHWIPNQQRYAFLALKNSSDPAESFPEAEPQNWASAIYARSFANRRINYQASLRRVSEHMNIAAFDWHEEAPSD
ncbi:MAG: PD40 domain-containing protein [Armatimonadetes bacterium]|nr:PD40 domain-containing protein [Anaerolineae bacterium]